MDKHQAKKGVALFCVILILALLVVFGGLRILESTVFHSNGQESSGNRVSKTVTVDGIDYFPRQDITVLLVIGVDQFGPVESSGFFRNDGYADMISLLIFDEKNEKCDVLYLNRDTMLNMPALGLDGRPAGTFYGQLSLSHTYGSGLNDSCEFTKEAVRNLLNGIHIDYYLSMNMDAIALLNDAVGGVKVNVTDDFSDIDPSITMGEMTLNGQQALSYVRSRQNLGDQKNITRMERQRGYVKGFVEAFNNKQDQSMDFVLNTYEDVAPYLVSDCPVNSFGNLLNKYKDYELMRIVSPEGENVLGNQFYEFYVDEEKLDRLIIELFYAPKE